MPDCIYYQNLCSASVDGTLTRAEKKELEAHLKTCPACREYLEDMRVMRTLWRELDDPAPAGLHGSIMAAVQADIAQQAPAAEQKPENEIPAAPVASPIPLHIKKRTRSVIVMLAAAAACVCLVVTGGFAGLARTGSAADNAAAAVVAAEAPGAAVSSEVFFDTASSGTSAENGARMTADSADSFMAKEEAAAAKPTQMMPVLRLPDALAERSFAATYLATGAGELPVIGEAMLLTGENGYSYYSLPNDISVLEEVIDTLSGAGYSVTVTESTSGEGTEDALSTDSVAAEVLLIVKTEG